MISIGMWSALLSVWFSHKDSRQVKIPQGKQCRTHVLKVLQVPHLLSTCTEAQWLPVVLPLLYSAARLFALLVPHSFRQICLLMPLYILTQILLEQSMLKSKICKFNFKTRKYFTGRYLSTLKLPHYMILLKCYVFQIFLWLKGLQDSLSVSLSSWSASDHKISQSHRPCKPTRPVCFP